MNRKRVLITLAVVSLLIIALAVGAFGFRSANNGPGRIELSATELDLGTVGNSGPVSRVLQIKNAGEGRLEITGVSTSCGCTTAEVSSRNLAPGEVTDLTVTYDPRVHDGDTGQFVRQVYIRSDDPDTPEASLTMQVTVVED